MRTKVLLCAAALAASLASSMAQNVYSLNVVGYYNVTIPANKFYMVANQLNTTNNSLDNIMSAAADGSQLNIYNGGYTTYTFDATIPGWTPGGGVLNPGQAGLFRDAGGGTGQVLTFVGEVLQNTSPGLINTLPASPVAKVNSVRASIVPQQGTLTGDLGVPGEDGDQANVYNGGYATYTFDATIPGWTPGDVNGPTINVGQGFFYTKAAGSVSTSWVRSFTVQ